MDTVSFEEPSSSKDFPITFNGTAGEYFKIWIVNVALTILTLGIYLPWAKVRTRRYFYANTVLDDNRFDYLANPKRMLKAYLVIYLAIILYVLGINNIISPFIGLGVILVLVALGPFFIASSLRFWMYNTSYRNVRFHFAGRTGEAYSTYWGYAFLTYITAGIIYPIFKLKISEYIYGNASIGKTPFNYKGESGPYFKIYLTALGIILGIGLLVGGVVVGTIAVTNASGSGFAEESAPFLFIGIIYGVYIPVFAIIIGFLGAQLLRYNLSVLSLGHDQDITFRSDVRIGRYIWVTVSNLLATLLSVGLLSPWAKVRAKKMVLSSITVTSAQGVIGTHEALANQDQSATGEAAVDAMDFDIGI